MEINQITADTNKLQAEANKLVAERLKLMAERGKLDHERAWYPLLIGGTVGAALLAAGAGLAKLFLIS